MADKQKTHMGMWDEHLMCFVRYRFVDHCRHVARLDLGDRGCTDMRGAITWAVREDPECCCIETFNELGPDTVYLRHSSQWQATTRRVTRPVISREDSRR